jgi:Trypsin-like peptidase domain
VKWNAAVTACVWTFIAPPIAWAQNAEELALMTRALVHIDSPRQGSGIIVGTGVNTVWIITARHVVEGDSRPISSLESRRPCDTLPKVIYESGTVGTGIKSICSDEYDLAVVEADVDPAFLNQLPKLRGPSSLYDANGSRILLAGRPVSKELSRSDNNDLFSANDDFLETRGSGAYSGFSGGAAVDLTGGLAGMVIITDNAVMATSLRWARINTILANWSVSADRLDGGLAEPLNPDFRVAVTGNPAVEGARNAVRQYTRALTTKRRDLLSTVYRSLTRSTVDALFGDAVQIDLALCDCLDISSNSNVVSCAYRMKVFRRTGPTVVLPTSSTANVCSQMRSIRPEDREKMDVPRITFELKNSQGQWEIINVR